MDKYKGIVVTEEGLQDCKATQKKLAGLRNNIDKYRKDLDQRISIINSDPGITINEELISINLVTVQ